VIRRTVALVAPLLIAPGLLSVLLQAPAHAGSERMQLECEDGRIIERSNGSTWWGVDHDAVYVTERIEITGGATFTKDFGGRGAHPDRSTCVAEHFGSTWTVVLVRVR
jgi:hypothetical protein